MSPKPAAEAPRTDFNAYRDSYRDAVQESIAFSGATPEFFSKTKAERLVELAARRLGEPRELDVVDVGCGIGQTDRFLEGCFRRLSGVDIASELVERATANNPWATYRSYVPGAPIPFERSSFDLSFAVCVLHHVPPSDWRAFVGEMTRVTRPGGLVAIFEHNPWNPLTRRSVSNCEFDSDAVLLSRRRARGLFEGQGLSIVESPYITFFTREGRLLRRIERSLGWAPAGAQYYVAGRRERDDG
jgi:SAM-dependent methyltransferase